MSTSQPLPQREVGEPIKECLVAGTWVVRCSARDVFLRLSPSPCFDHAHCVSIIWLASTIITRAQRRIGLLAESCELSNYTPHNVPLVIHISSFDLLATDAPW